MTGINGVGRKLGPAAQLPQPVMIHGYRQGLNRSGAYYVKPNLPGDFTQIQRANYAKQVTACF